MAATGRRHCCWNFPTRRCDAGSWCCCAGSRRAAGCRWAGFEKTFAIADEDLPRENDEKTSAVHFLRFELDAPRLAALKRGASLGAGVDHDHYRHAIEPVGERIRASLLGDLN